MKFWKILVIASTVVAAKPQAIPDPFQTGIGRVRDGYLNIQQALAGDDFQRSRTAAESLMVSLKGIHTKGLKDPAKSQWDSSAARMMKVLNPMSSSKDIDAMRSRFAGLTPLVVDAIEKFGLKSAPPVYLYHCPMANANWLQKDKTKANPFYGKSMSECGSLVREVKPL